MRICEIKIGQFGGIKNKDIPLHAGINLIMGDNESGKSTLCAFIKFVLYGFSTPEERKKHTSLLTGKSEGSLIIEGNDGVIYRIERADTEKGRGKVTVKNDFDGTEFTDWKEHAQTPGDYFLGIPEALYSRSLYVSQEYGAELDGKSAEAVNNLLLTGNEATNLKRAKSILDGIRKEYRLRRGVGGLIPETEQRIAHLKDKLSRKIEEKHNIEALTMEMNETSNQSIVSEETLEKLRERRKNRRAAEIRKLFSETEKVGNTLTGCKVRQDELEKNNTVGTFLPSDEYISDLERTEAETKSAGVVCEDLRVLESLAKKQLGDKPKGYAIYEKHGTQKILSEYRSLKRKRAFSNVISFISILLALAAATVFALSYLEMYELLPQKTSLMAFAGAFFAFILSLIFKLRPTKLLKKLNALLGVTKKRPPEIVCLECEAHNKGAGGNVKEISAKLKAAEAEFGKKAADFAQKLAKWNKASVEEAKRDYAAYVERKKALVIEREEHEKRYEFFRGKLAGFTEKDKEYALSLTEAEINRAYRDEVSDEDVANAEKALETSKTRLSELRVKRAETGVDSDENIEAIDAEIRELEAKLEDYKAKCMAAELAEEMLTRAETGIRDTVSPYLGRYAGELFGDMTDGKYNAISITSDFGMSYSEQNGSKEIDSMYLSGGSADLAWLCLRMALHRKLSDGKSLPLIFDECFVYFDEKRLARIIDKLVAISKNGTQVIIFSASEREKKLSKRRLKITNLSEVGE